MKATMMEKMFMVGVAGREGRTGRTGGVAMLYFAFSGPKWSPSKENADYFKCALRWNALEKFLMQKFLTLKLTALCFKCVSKWSKKIKLSKKWNKMPKSAQEASKKLQLLSCCTVTQGTMTRTTFRQLNFKFCSKLALEERRGWPDWSYGGCFKRAKSAINKHLLLSSQHNAFRLTDLD